MFPVVSFLRRTSGSTVFVRGYRGRPRRDANPGVSRRFQLLKHEASNDGVTGIDDETLENMESDFMNSRDIYAYHKQEFEKMKKKIELSQVERKYFGKEKYPNMLMWGEKEQIRQLHSSDPDFWNFEKLSQSFPALPHVIKKIIKSQWKLKESADIERHDKGVVANWKKLKEGSLDLDDSLREYLLSFSARERSTISDFKYSPQTKQKVLSCPAKEGEFSRIISSYKEQIGIQENPNENDKPMLKLNEGKKPFVDFTSSRFSRKHVTLAELRKETKDKLIDRGFLASESEKHFMAVRTEENTNFHPVLEENPEIFQKTQKSQAPVTKIEDNESIVSLAAPDAIPMRIRIPKKLRRKGLLFKKMDCFYDSQGYFVYRVPGMVS